MFRPSARLAQCCWSCSSKLLKQSSASAPQILPAATAPRILPRSYKPATRQTFHAARTYSSLDKPPVSPENAENPDLDQELDPEPFAELEAESEPKDESATASSTSPSATPWYLEVEPPRHPTLIPQQHPLPEIPDESPKLLKPLVKFVSDELGIDRLTLLDLRKLDPPPALGPKLLMLFGSARMERHLHVSADRLVRWLAGHGIQATADGLMTRNELKLKMRRAARRAKTMSMAGGNAGDNQALATSWICINLGTLNWSAEEVDIRDADRRVAGFGSAQSGTTVVVQLFTEAKRKELDLETLWGRQLEKSERLSAQISGLPPPARPKDPFLEAFGDAAKPNRKTRRSSLQRGEF